MANGNQPGFNQMTVWVHFDPNAPTPVWFSGAGVDDQNRIEVPQGLALIVLVLQPLLTADGLRGKFPSRPIQWVDAERSPVTPPLSYLVHRTGDYNVTIQVLNTALARQELPFFVLVQDGRQFWSNDPTIVNLPPTGPPFA